MQDAENEGLQTTPNGKVKQLEGIVDDLLMDNGDLKQQQLNDQREENIKLSETVAIKMEVIYKLELNINDILKNDQNPTRVVDVNQEEQPFSQANARTAATQTHKNNKGIRPTMPLDTDLGKPKLDLIITK